VSRPKALIIYALIALGLVALFVAFIAFRRNAALIAALEAAGTVAAAGFAAVAATGSMRAAAESSASARRSREVVARTMQPRLRPGVSQENGTVLGKLDRGTGGRAAVDVTVVWIFRERGPVTGQTARLETSHAVDLEVPEGANVWNELNTVWCEYWDDSHAGHWRDTWRVEGPETFVLTHSDLVD
jgi:hypothetical protein